MDMDIHSMLSGGTAPWPATWRTLRRQSTSLPIYPWKLAVNQMFPSLSAASP